MEVGVITGSDGHCEMCNAFDAAVAGMQKHVENDVTESVQGALEEGLRRLRPKNEIHVYSSSRTDKGVHALCNTAHVDLEHWKDQEEYKPEFITQQANKYLLKEKHDISIIKTIPVGTEFSARHCALGRSYLYRLAVDQSKGVLTQNYRGKMIPQRQPIPIVETNRCFIVSNNFDESKFLACSSALAGVHDYATFMCKGSTEKEYLTLRKLHINVTPGRGLMAEYDPLYGPLKFYDLTFSSRGFLYKQIRKLVGAMVACAADRLSMDEVHYMLNNPSVDNWLSKVSLAPPYGLYLKTVDYNTNDFQNPPTPTQHTQQTWTDTMSQETVI